LHLSATCRLRIYRDVETRLPREDAWDGFAEFGKRRLALTAS